MGEGVFPPTPSGAGKVCPRLSDVFLRPPVLCLFLSARPAPTGGECLLRSGDGSGDSGRMGTCKQKKRPATKMVAGLRFPGESGPDGP